MERSVDGQGTSVLRLLIVGGDGRRCFGSSVLLSGSPGCCTL